MGLDVDPPSPPELSPGLDADEYDDVDVQGGEYRREELQEFLEDGAWDRAFHEWTEHTDMDESEFAIATDLALFERFDFFWDDFADRVGYTPPASPRTGVNGTSTPTSTRGVRSRPSTPASPNSARSSVTCSKTSTSTGRPTTTHPTTCRTSTSPGARRSRRTSHGGPRPATRRTRRRTAPRAPHQRRTAR